MTIRRSWRFGLRIAALILVAAVLSTGFCLYGGEAHHHAHAASHVTHMMAPLCAGMLASTAPVLTVVAPVPIAWFSAERPAIVHAATVALLDPPPRPLRAA